MRSSGICTSMLHVRLYHDRWTLPLHGRSSRFHFEVLPGGPPPPIHLLSTQCTCNAMVEPFNLLSFLHACGGCVLRLARQGDFNRRLRGCSCIGRQHVGITVERSCSASLPSSLYFGRTSASFLRSCSTISSTSSKCSRDEPRLLSCGKLPTSRPRMRSFWRTPIRRRAPPILVPRCGLSVCILSQIHRGNTRKALLQKLERVQGNVPQRDWGTPFHGAYRRISHVLNSARTSWGGKSVVGSLAELQVPSTPIGSLAWEKAVGGSKKYNKLLQSAQEDEADASDDEDGDVYGGPSREPARWQPQPQPVMHMAVPPRTHPRSRSLAQAQY